MPISSSPSSYDHIRFGSSGMTTLSPPYSTQSKPMAPSSPDRSSSYGRPTQTGYFPPIASLFRDTVSTKNSANTSRDGLSPQSEGHGPCEYRPQDGSGQYNPRPTSFSSMSSQDQPVKRERQSPPAQASMDMLAVNRMGNGPPTPPSIDSVRTTNNYYPIPSTSALAPSAYTIYPTARNLGENTPPYATTYTVPTPVYAPSYPIPAPTYDLSRADAAAAPNPLPAIGYPYPPFPPGSATNLPGANGNLSAIVHPGTMRPESEQYEPASSIASYSSGSSRKRRGNLPKEATAILKSWFEEHRSNPYPTDEQKLMLKDKTGLTLNQINNWFINARRRLPGREARESRNAMLASSANAINGPESYHTIPHNPYGYAPQEQNWTYGYPQNSHYLPSAAGPPYQYHPTEATAAAAAAAATAPSSFNGQYQPTATATTTNIPATTGGYSHYPPHPSAPGGH